MEKGGAQVKDSKEGNTGDGVKENKDLTRAYNGQNVNSKAKLPEIRVINPFGSLASILSEGDNTNDVESPRASEDTAVEAPAEDENISLSGVSDAQLPFDDTLDTAAYVLQARQSYASRRGVFWERAVQVLDHFRLHPVYLTETEYVNFVLSRREATHEWLQAHLIQSKQLRCGAVNSFLEAQSKLERNDIDQHELSFDYQVFERMKPDEQDFFIFQFKILKAHVALCKEGLYLDPIAFEAFINMAYEEQLNHIELLKDEVDRNIALEVAQSTARLDIEDYSVADVLFDNDLKVTNLSTTRHSSLCESDGLHSTTTFSNSDERKGPLTAPPSYASQAPKTKLVGKVSHATLTQKIFNVYGTQKIRKKRSVQNGVDKKPVGQEVDFRQPLKELTLHRPSRRLRKSLSKVFGSLKVNGRNEDTVVDFVHKVNGVLDLEV